MLNVVIENICSYLEEVLAFNKNPNYLTLLYKSGYFGQGSGEFEN